MGSFLDVLLFTTKPGVELKLPTQILAPRTSFVSSDNDHKALSRPYTAWILGLGPKVACLGLLNKHEGSERPLQS